MFSRRRYLLVSRHGRRGVTGADPELSDIGVNDRLSGPASVSGELGRRPTSFTCDGDRSSVKNRFKHNDDVTGATAFQRPHASSAQWRN